jgi:hypothetical protein
MAVIEHGPTVYRCEICGGKRIERDNGQSCAHPPEFFGEYIGVRPDQLRGAVEALRAIAADPQLGGTGHPVDVLARAALEALGLDPTGGQS